MSSKKVNIALDIISIILISILIVGSIIIWPKLPPQIPNHVDSMGNVKDYVTRNFIFFPATIGSMIGIGILILSRYPKIYNYVVPITDDNKEIQYSIATRMMRIVNIEMILIFIYMEYLIISASNNIVVIVILTIILFLTIWYYIKKSMKYKG